MISSTKYMPNHPSINADRSSLKNLKFHIAEDGCSEVQYDLARQLLEESSGLFENF